jgi:ATP-dependent helicase/nuclease subunit A
MRIASNPSPTTRSKSCPVIKARHKPPPPDQPERTRALDTTRSILVQAPAGSGKTDLLTRRFLALLAEVDQPGEIVAITFTKAAAAEMRNRILAELEKAAAIPLAASSAPTDQFSMEALARRALARSQSLGWQILDLPAQLRISTIDSFCRDLAIQQPLLSGFGHNLQVAERPQDLYHRAARNALKNAGSANPSLQSALENLLLWRDNDWLELETLLVQMLAKRDSWMHPFVLDRDPDWDDLRARLEAPFVNAIRTAIFQLDAMLDQVPGARFEAHELAAFACEQSGRQLHLDLAELAEFPCRPFSTHGSVECALAAMQCLADLVLKKDGAFRGRVDKNNGFPPGSNREKARLLALIDSFRKIDGLESALGALSSLPSVRFTQDEWQIVRACFLLLRQAAAELQVVFAEAGTVDFTEVAQLAQRVLRGPDDLPTDAALAFADGIRHLLVDEFQDTSRRQHQLLASLTSAWPDPAGRTLFVVGDPMQSIYFFRDADAELFPRVRDFGLEIPGADAHPFTFVPLKANFRTQPALVRELNSAFTQIFAADDGSGVTFSHSEAAREGIIDLFPRLTLHTDFMPIIAAGDSSAQQKRQAIRQQRDAIHSKQTFKIVHLIRGYSGEMEHARAQGEKFRIAVLGRTRKSLERIAMELRNAGIPFRAVELEPLRDRPEVLDALALSRALLNPFDRIAWLGVLRAPWCGLSLAELHALTSADDPALPLRSVPDLIAARLELLSPQSRPAVQRVIDVAASTPTIAAASPTLTLGTWLEQVWLRMGGSACVDRAARANLHLLWRCLDDLPNGAQDFVGAALDNALETLTAIPDPEADPACGVQLMTIHKSKGLEFEVVFVPELQAHGFNTRGRLLSWIERGLSAPDAYGALTEFLIAPVQTKGGERSKTRLWVDRLYREREQQESRRIFYVAATRAREELQLFARPEYRDDPIEPRMNEAWNCLLATAWPAFGTEIRARFRDWLAARSASQQREPGSLEGIAASAAPIPPKPTQLRRLPADFQAVPFTASPRPTADRSTIEIGAEEAYRRHEGGLNSRALGSAVHKLLEEFSRRPEMPAQIDRSAILQQLLPRVKAQVRAAGISPNQAHAIATRALQIALGALGDPVGRWILTPRTAAISESAWTGIVAEVLRSVRVDRTFLAGLEPLSEGDAAWWIIDYKTALADEHSSQQSLPALRSLFAPQLETYAGILRNLRGDTKPICCGLYYPRIAAFDWWASEA